MIVEDGTGLSNSDSYLSVADADTYWTAHGSPTDWTGATTANKEAALVYATRWLDDNFSWLSNIYKTTQALDWPRWSYYDSEGRTIAVGVPQRIKDATAELALAWVSGELYSSSGQESISSEKVGNSSVTYRNGSYSSSSGSYRSFGDIKLMLREYGSASKSTVNILYRA